MMMSSERLLVENNGRKTVSCASCRLGETMVLGRKIADRLLIGYVEIPKFRP